MPLCQKHWCPSRLVYGGKEEAWYKSKEEVNDYLALKTAPASGPTPASSPSSSSMPPPAWHPSRRLRSWRRRLPPRTPSGNKGGLTDETLCIDYSLCGAVEALGWATLPFRGAKRAGGILPNPAPPPQPPPAYLWKHLLGHRLSQRQGLLEPLLIGAHSPADHPLSPRPAFERNHQVVDHVRRVLDGQVYDRL